MRLRIDLRDVDDCPKEPEQTSPAACPQPGPASELTDQSIGEVHLPVVRSKPSFSNWSTALWSIALVTGAVFVLFSVSNSREQLIEHPAAYLDRVVGRDLDAAEYAARMTVWERLLNAWDVSTASAALEEGIETYQRFVETGAVAEDARVRQTIAILLAEARRFKEAQEELNKPGEGRVSSNFRELFERAYGAGQANGVPLRSLSVVDEVTPEWARDKLAQRLAERRGDRAAARQIEDRLQRRGARIQQRATVISVVDLLLVGGALGIIAAWLWRRGSLQSAHGNPVSPWKISEGYAVLVRGGTAGMILAAGLAYLSEEVSWITGFATLLSAAPLLLLTQRHLLAPEERSLKNCFGLAVTRGEARRIIWITIGLAGLMILGETVLAEITSHWQEASLAESTPEEFLFGSWSEVLFSALDAVIWAPLVEEVAFRGLLYATLRRRLPVWGAAGLSSVIFGVVHGYSLQGLLIICWSGFVWALAYEKSRSLWPGIFCHAISNALAVASPILLYRL